MGTTRRQRQGNEKHSLEKRTVLRATRSQPEGFRSLDARLGFSRSLLLPPPAMKMSLAPEVPPAQGINHAKT
jgi:hypothetical protein